MSCSGNEKMERRMFLYVMPNSFTKPSLRNHYLLETVVGVRDIEVIKSEVVTAVMGFIF